MFLNIIKALSVLLLQQFLKIFRDVLTIFYNKLESSFFKLSPTFFVPEPYFLIILIIPIIFKEVLFLSLISSTKKSGLIIFKIFIKFVINPCYLSNFCT